MSLGKKNNLSSLEGYFLLPDWWIRAFENSLIPESGAIDKSISTGIFPSLTTEELNALVNILAMIQKMVLFSDTPHKLILDLNKYRKSFTQNRQHFFSYDRVVELFCSLRFMIKKVDIDKNYSYKTRRIVTDFSIEPTTNLSVESDFYSSFVRLELSSLGLSSCIGYQNPYQFILDPTLEYLPGQPPILVSSSTWADLNIYEQLIYLIMKKSMYWDNTWLHFDGIFGTDFSSIKSTLIPYLSSRTKHKSLVLKDFIDKITKKLLEHGFLTHCCASSYLAMTENSHKNLFIWQASLKELALLSDKLFCSKCLIQSSYFIKKDFIKLVNILSDKLLSQEESLKLKDFYELVEKKFPIYFYPVLCKNTCYPIPMIWLFIEWCLRNNKNHKFNIKDSIQDQTLIDICKITKEDSKEDLLERLESFSTIMYRNNKLTNLLQNTKYSSLALESSLKDLDVISYLKKYLDQGYSNLSLYSKEKSKSNVLISDKKTDSSLTNSIVNERSTKDLKINTITQKELELASNNKIKITSGIKNIIPKLDKTVSSPAFQNLKKIALEELNTLKAKNPERYSLLKQNYINSLSEEKRQILLDVHDRVSEDVFDSHLRHGLLKYMVDNPSSWSSAKNS